MGKKEVRHNFRTEVFERDKKCMVCGNTSMNYMDAHHITDRNEMPNGGYVKENGITVCEGKCHTIVEQFHISNGKNWYLGKHPDDLYKLIGSSKELAIEKSEML